MSEKISKLFWTLTGLCAGSLVVYVFLVQGAVYYALSTNALSSLIETKEANLAVLEGRYYGEAEGVNLALAKQMGFVDAQNTEFVDAGSETRLVGYANQGAR